MSSLPGNRLVFREASTLQALSSMSYTVWHVHKIVGYGCPRCWCWCWC